MNSTWFNGSAPKALMVALIGLAMASLCGAQTTATNPVMIRCGQGGLIALPSTEPSPTSYALTGEQSQNAQAQQAWQKQTGPVYQVGNARIVLGDAR